PTVEPPSVFDYAGRYQVLKTGVWGQGPVFGQQLALLDGLGLDDAGYGTPDYLHAVIEAAKLAFADREAWYGDPAAPGTLALLLDPESTAARRALIGPEASLELRPGHLGDRSPKLPWFARSPVGEALGGVGARPGLTGSGEPTLGTAGAGEPV